jgi:hypothetical protein
MTKKSISIGSLTNFHSYDNAVFDKSIITEDPVSVGDPVDPEDAVNMRTAFSGVSVSSLTAPTELTLKDGTVGKLIVAACGSSFTLYAWNNTGLTNQSDINMPFVVKALGDPTTGTQRWYAIGGMYSIEGLELKGNIGTYILYIKDTNLSNYLGISWNENDTSDRVLTIKVNGGNRALDLKTVASVILDQSLAHDENVEFNTVKCQGHQVLGAQQAATVDLSSLTSIALNSGTDQVDRAAFNLALVTLVSELNSALGKVNTILAAMRAHGLIAT